jgi:hypothetical protein
MDCDRSAFATNTGDWLLTIERETAWLLSERPQASYQELQVKQQVERESSLLEADGLTVNCTFVVCLTAMNVNCGIYNKESVRVETTR